MLLLAMSINYVQIYMCIRWDIPTDSFFSCKEAALSTKYAFWFS